MNEIYFDNAATTRIDDRVLDSMMPYLTEDYGNPNSVYSFGRKAREAIEASREIIARAINTTPEHIIFTSGGSEANNTVIRGFNGCTICLNTEHDSVINPSVLELSLEEFDNYENEWIFRGGLMSAMHTNNELGFRNDLVHIKDVCDKRGTKLHVDCVQAFGYDKIDVEEIGCDFASFSSHKIHGPKGVGALYVRDFDLIKRPLIMGGTTQEFGYRGGTENVAGIVGFGKAVELCEEERDDYKTVILSLKNALENQIMRIQGVHFNCKNGSSKIVSLRVDGVQAETLVAALSAYGIYVSAGSACRSNESEPSRTLVAYGLTDSEARNTIRISFSKYNEKDDVTKFVDTLELILKSIRGEI